MYTPRVSVITRRKLVKQFNVGRQRATGEVRFDQVVAEDAVIRECRLSRRLECIHIVHAFADKTSRASVPSPSTCVRTGSKAAYDGRCKIGLFRLRRIYG